MTTLRHPGVVRSLLGLGMLLAAGCFWEIAPLRGQDGEVAVRNIQWNLVPLNKRNVWPPGDWQPIRRQRLEKLRTNVSDPTVAPREFPIRRAVYSATLTPNDMLEGGLVLTVDQANDGRPMIPLDPLSLPVTDLAWPDGEAVWGSTPEGQLVVQSRRDQGSLAGRWTLRGEKRPGGLLFEMHVARAAASQLTLTLPENYDVQCATAVVDAPHAADVPGWRKWKIELGRQTRCRVVLHESAPELTPAPLIVLSDNRVKYTSAPEQFRIQNRLRLDILKAPLSDLEFVTESDVQIHAVIADGDASLPMVQQTTDDRRTVRVHFDPPLFGPGHVLLLQATAPLTMERQIHLPRITIPGAVVGGGRINVIVPPPFELQKITTPQGYRQEDTSSGGNAVAFHYYGKAGDVTAVFGWPRAEVSCRIFSHLHSTRDQWEAQTQLMWQCQSGQRFTLKCEFPAEWDITVVSLRSSTGKIVTADDWTIVPGARDTRTLVVKLSESLSVTNPVTMEVLATRPMTAHHEPLAIPAPVPLDTENVETLVSVAERSNTQPILKPGATFSPMSKLRVSPFWKQFSLWDTAKQTDRSSLVFLSTAARPQGQFQFQSDQTPLNITAKVRMSLSDDRAEEVFEITGRATIPAVSQILVFVNEPGPEITWQLPGAEATSLKTRKLATSRHQALGLPRFGELWEIEFTPPAEAFSLVGRRTRAFAASGQASLVFVPRAKSFQGMLEVEADPKIQPRFISQNLVELQDVDVSPSNNQAAAKSHRWSYRAVEAGLRIETQLRSSGSPAAAISSVDIHSQISSTADGENRHWVVVDLTALSDTVELEWTLPESAQPGSVRLGDQTVEPYRVGESFRLQRGARDQTGVAVIHFRTPSVQRFGPGIVQIPVPKFNVPILRFSWTVACPPRTQMQILNANARPSGTSIGNSWRRRFLGPLAQQPAFPPTQDAAPNLSLRRALEEGDDLTGVVIPNAPPRLAVANI